MRTRTTSQGTHTKFPKYHHSRCNYPDCHNYLQCPAQHHPTYAIMLRWIILDHSMKTLTKSRRQYSIIPPLRGWNVAEQLPYVKEPNPLYCWIAVPLKNILASAMVQNSEKASAALSFLAGADAYH